MRRPSGSRLDEMGWVFITASLFPAELLFREISENYFTMMLVLSVLLFSLGIFFRICGYLIYAIYFLPGREFNSEGLEIRKCDYCNHKFLFPQKPCSDVPTSDLRDTFHHADIGRCGRVLMEKGFISQ